MCAHRGVQRWGESYFETHAPVVNWLSVRFLLALSVALYLDTRSIDFIIACLQDNLKQRVFMEILWSFTAPGEENPDAFCMELLVN